MFAQHTWASLFAASKVEKKLLSKAINALAKANLTQSAEHMTQEYIGVFPNEFNVKRIMTTA